MAQSAVAEADSPGHRPLFAAEEHSHPDVARSLRREARANVVQSATPLRPQKHGIFLGSGCLEVKFGRLHHLLGIESCLSGDGFYVVLD